ncbi:MAG TPA: DUF2254 domain-containing protein [Bryobacteraceae bacterium]|nr:DUF2254 domain-containing protein [Bryobacteraceae bacterium]
MSLPRRLPLLFRRAMYNLRGGFLVRPLSIALALGCAGALLSEFEESFPALGGWTPGALFPSHADPQVAQIILGGIAGSIMTVVSIVFAIMLMTLTLASMQFSPRIIVSFVQDRVTQWTLGIFLGTFLYCIAALPAARSLPHPFAPVFTVMVAMLLAVACVGWLLFFIHHISRAISVNHIVDRIAADTIAMIDETMPWPHRPERLGEAAAGSNWEATIVNSVSGYIRFVDRKRLVELAKTYRVKINVLRRVGHFVPAGVPLLAVSKDGRLTPEGLAELRGAFDFGPTRTLQQDVEFGVLQIVDIALKAISPAVNDPSTAINCVDQLSAITIRFAAHEPPDAVLYDPPGTARVFIPWIGFDRLLEAAFEQIRLYSKSDVAVSLRLLRALGDIAATTPDPDYRRMLAERGRRVVAGCAEKLGNEEMQALRARLDALNH